jgi:hypothetical protein
LHARSSATARQVSDSRAEEVGFRRFFRNADVTVKEILETAVARTAQAAAGRHVLVIQDTSEINYQAKAGRKRNRGRVGNGTDAGLFVHPGLAGDAEDGSVVGLAAATIWRWDKVKDPDYQKLPIEEKESHRWILTPIAARDALKPAALVTEASDRESDIYEVFAGAPDARPHVLAPAHHERKLGKVSKSLFKTIAAQPVAGFIELDLVGRPGRLARKVALTVRFCEVTLEQPRLGADRRDPGQLSLTAVEVAEENPPPGEEPILWRLLTTHEVASLEDARRVVDWYRLRWTIEQLFRTLKSQGIALEESLIADGEALERLAAAMGMPRSINQMRRALPCCHSILARKSRSVVLSEVLPERTSYASGRPSGVTTKAITTCTQSGRWSREWPKRGLSPSANGGSASKYALVRS